MGPSNFPHSNVVFLFNRQLINASKSSLFCLCFLGSMFADKKLCTTNTAKEAFCLLIGGIRLFKAEDTTPTFPLFSSFYCSKNVNSRKIMNLNIYYIKRGIKLVRMTVAGIGGFFLVFIEAYIVLILKGYHSIDFDGIRPFVSIWSLNFFLLFSIFTSIKPWVSKRMSKYQESSLKDNL